MESKLDLDYKFRIRLGRYWYAYFFSDGMPSLGFYHDIFYDGITYHGFNTPWFSIMVADFDFSKA